MEKCHHAKVHHIKYDKGKKNPAVIAKSIS